MHHPHQEALFRPLEAAIATFIARARADLAAGEQTTQIAVLMRREHALDPLDSLADAVARLTRNQDRAVPKDQGQMT